MRARIKIISFILTLSLVFPLICVGNANAKTIQSPVDKYVDVFVNGYTVPTTKYFMDNFRAFGHIFEKFTGMKIFTDEKINLVIEGFIKDVYDEVYTKSDGTMDFDLFFKSLPISSAPAKKYYEITHVDRQELVDYLKQKNIQADEEGSSIALFYFFARIYMNLFDDVVIGARSVDEQEGIYEILVTVYYCDGTKDEMTPGIYYNANTKYLYSPKGDGVMGLGYNLDVENATLESVTDCWQKQFGFCLFYDVFSYLTPFFDYDTRRMKFDYEGKEWMIQIWKGRYIITTGCEIGIYTKDKDSHSTVYMGADGEDMLKMSMKLYHFDDLIVSREKTAHWWLTAFRFTPKCYLPNSMKMYGEIEMKSDEMAQLFCKSARKYFDFKVNSRGKTVSFVW